MSEMYDRFFNRIPTPLLGLISNGCRLGDAAYKQITKSDSRFFNSLYVHGLRPKLHDKAIQMYLEDRLQNKDAVHVFSKHTGFGNRVAVIYGNDFGIIPCHVSKMGKLPSLAKYKLNACESNPDNDITQTSLLMPPVAEDYTYIQFFLTFYFNGMNSIPTLVLPNRSISTILDYRPIISVVTDVDMDNEEIQRRERIIPKLISEVAKENEQNQNNG